MGSSTISLPADFATNILSFATNLFSSWSTYITLILGILLSAVVLEIIIGAIRNHK